MLTLSETQLVILSAAMERPDHSILPLPGRLRGGAAQKVIGALLARGLAAEVKANPGEPIWREDGEGRGLRLGASEAAEDAPRVEADTRGEVAAEGQSGGRGQRDCAAEVSGATGGLRSARAATRHQAGAARAMLGRPEGATVEELVAATGWQPHTVRGVISGALKKRLGIDVGSAKVDDRGQVYKIKA